MKEVKDVKVAGAATVDNQPTHCLAADNREVRVESRAGFVGAMAADTRLNPRQLERTKCARDGNAQRRRSVQSRSEVNDFRANANAAFANSM